MRAIAGVVAVLVVLSVVWACLRGYHWEVFYSPDNQFSVEVPGKIDPVENGVVSNPETGVFYLCTFLDDPGEHPISTYPMTEKLLDSYRNALVGQRHGRVVSDRPTSIQ